MADELEDYREQVIKEYRDQVKKYSQEIRMGDDSTFNYSMLFNSYWRLYQFSSKMIKSLILIKKWLKKLVTNCC